MATKDYCLSSMDKQQTFNGAKPVLNCNDQYTNLNLNQSHKCSKFDHVQSKIISTNCKTMLGTLTDVSDYTYHGDNLKERTKELWNEKNVYPKSSTIKFKKDTQNPTEQDKKVLPANRSTLSLHIAAYENSIIDSNERIEFKIEKSKKTNFKEMNVKEYLSTSSLTSNFEIPRQQENGSKTPEIMRFKASQKLFSPRRSSSAPGTPKKNFITSMHDVYSEVTPRNTLPRGHRPRPRSSFYRNPKTSEIKNEYPPSDSSSTTLISVDLNKVAAGIPPNNDEEKRSSRRSLYLPDSTTTTTTTTTNKIKSLGSRHSSVNGSSLTKLETDMEEPSSSQKEDNLAPLRCFTTSKAKRVRFYRNGDQFFKGIWYAVSADRFRSLKVLMEELNRLLADSINLPHGVRHIFTLDGMMTLETVEQFKDGQSYVCSSSEIFKPLNYLSARQPVWCSASSKPQASRSTSHIRNFNFVREPNEFVYPRIITIIRNGVKPRRVVRHLLNKKTAQSFDQVMQDITAIVKLDCGLVRRLFTIKGRLVTNLQEFFGEDDVFIAYGNEKTSLDDFYIANDESRSLFSSNTRKSRRNMGKRALPLRNDSIRQHPRGFSISTNNGELPTLPSPVNEQFELIRVLGDGNTAIVYEALCRDDDVRKALKVILKENITTTRQYIDTELALMKELSHENIVHMFQYWLIDDSFFVSLELVPDGDLFECLRTVRSYGEREASNLVRCLASALHYIHEKQIVHRDVKPENLLVYVDPTNGLPALKLADFGLASVLEDDKLLYDVCGTPTYVAPEILAELGYSTKVDIWSAGIIIYVLLCGFPPFMSMEEHSQDALFEQILRGRFGFPSPIWDNISYSAKALIQGLLHLDVEERFTAAQILDYHWIKGIADVHEEFEEMARVCVEARLTQEAEMDDVDASNGFEESNAEYYWSRRASMDELSESQGGNRYSPLAESEASFTAVYTPRK